MVNNLAGVSRNLQLKFDLASHLAGKVVENPRQRSLVQQISQTLEQSIGTTFEHVSHSEKGEITVWAENKPIEIGVAINNFEIGSPRPWALARSLGHIGRGSLDEPYQKAIQSVENAFYKRHGHTGIFTDSSRADLLNAFTELLALWIGNPAFMNKGAIQLAATKWVGWGKCTIFVSGKNYTQISVLNLAGLVAPNVIDVNLSSINRFELDFGLEKTFTCRVHTDSKSWNSDKRLPIKMSFEYN